VVVGVALGGRRSAADAAVTAAAGAICVEEGAVGVVGIYFIVVNRLNAH
jgi:hypothetical protein